MRVLETDKRDTEIVLTVQEKKDLQKVSRFLIRLFKHHGGDMEKAASEAIAPVAAKWAPEEKTDATK